MSTFMAKAETIERRWFVIDAANKPLGKTAVEAATILRGVTTFGAVESDRAMTTFCWFPPERLPIRSSRETILVWN